MNMITHEDRLHVERKIHPEFRVHWSAEPWAITTTLETVLDIGTEVQRFCTDRFRADCVTHQRLLHCRTPADLMGVQACFMRRAVADYRAHTAKMVKLAERLWFPTAQA
ncbi:phasin family protein [Salipiger sp. 1_MG-2023]|uniref:phasin family protein n=1 Tax=Salipiger sp. 1_MG-2023 TaxID=3062665 RepID=UPI0026E397A2|nr:phasin family protein [Salipiger sp. 1_MG-2023]MDO6584503.1 phasin family protein [Salipiger sp. 1_MG-2023]